MKIRCRIRIYERGLPGRALATRDYPAVPRVGDTLDVDGKSLDVIAVLWADPKDKDDKSHVELRVR